VNYTEKIARKLERKFPDLCQNDKLFGEGCERVKARFAEEPRPAKWFFDDDLAIWEEEFQGLKHEQKI
jgi:hypothetical protein